METPWRLTSRNRFHGNQLEIGEFQWGDHFDSKAVHLHNESDASYDRLTADNPWTDDINQRANA